MSGTKGNGQPGSAANSAAVMALGGSMAETFSRMSRTAMAGAVQVQAEMSQFLSGRIKQNSESLAALMHCRNLGEVAQVQGDWLKDALDSWMAEAARLQAMGTSTATELTGAAQPPHA